MQSSCILPEPKMPRVLRTLTLLARHPLTMLTTQQPLPHATNDQSAPSPGCEYVAYGGNGFAKVVTVFDGVG